MEPFLGEIILVPYNFPPKNYAFCQGQILSIAQNTALFALLGTNYGGNGTTTFALPDLQARVAMGQGSGPGLTPRDMGEEGGEDNHTLLATEIPSHNHGLQVGSGNANSVLATDNFPAKATGNFDEAYNPAPSGSQMAPNTLAVIGNGAPHTNDQPTLVLNYCIALVGIFPQRP